MISFFLRHLKSTKRGNCYLALPFANLTVNPHSQKAPESGAQAVFSQYHRFRDKVFIEKKSTLGQSWQGEAEENKCCSFSNFDWMAPPPAQMTR